ncbi:MAG: ABC transporter ATP-binding protein [Christensenellales bacterium]
MIETHHLFKEYKGACAVKVLKDINLCVEEKEFVAIMGPSGSGKSTLMHILGCLDKPSSGTYLLYGMDPSKMNDRQLAQLRNETIGFVFQSFFLLPHMTAAENMELPLIYRNVLPAKRKRKVAEMLDRLDLNNRALHFPSQLSGGQRQRVAIGRALVSSPSLLLADEPTGNLDTAAGKDIMALFRELHTDGCTVVLITHEKEIAQYAQRMVMIRDGRVM